jgi:ATP-dependent HslUV protease ATP-binding subunit HslU
VALRNRWRRKRVPDDLRDEVTPKNILMIGPTGVGKTEIARRLAKLAQAPFLKVEATKFTEVGYVGRDVDQIIRDLVESAIHGPRSAAPRCAPAPRAAAEERMLDALTGPGSQPATRESFRKKLRAGELDDKEVEIALADTASPMPMMDIPGSPARQMSAMLNLGEMLGKAFGGRTKTVKLTVRGALGPADRRGGRQAAGSGGLTTEALSWPRTRASSSSTRSTRWPRAVSAQGADVSREGVQRDLLPLIEGTTVSTKYGPVKTDHILFIASGAFHVAKPSDLLPELQGRLPIRVELKALTRDDMRRILTEPEANLIRQHQALLGDRGCLLDLHRGRGRGHRRRRRGRVNGSVENIGARRLQTVLERVLEETSFRGKAFRRNE